MSASETFFAFGFISTFAVAIVVIWFGYVVPQLISQYRILVYHLYHWNPSSPKNPVNASQQATNPELEIQPISVG